MANILLVDDHTLIRSALRIIATNLLSNCHIEEASDGDSAFEKIKSLSFSLVIMDVSMPNTDSFALVHNILAFQPRTKILVFSMNPEDIYAKRYLNMGAMGYLRKDAGEEEIRKAITTVLNNKRYISRTLADSIAEDAFNNKPANPFDKLSPREFEVLQHLIQGKSVAQICQQLNLNSSTVSSHKTRILEKLGVTNPVEMNILARTYNII